MQCFQPSSTSAWQLGQRVNDWLSPQWGQKFTVRLVGSAPPQ
jgi:hypothetical protein